MPIIVVRALEIFCSNFPKVASNLNRIASELKRIADTLEITKAKENNNDK